MMRETKIALVAVTAIAAASLGLFLEQGGFGAGHGKFDLVIFILGLPWDWLISKVPEGYNPSLFSKHDVAWLIAVPFVLNIVLVLAISVVVRALRGRSKSRGAP
jgi:hypothetical protein